MAGARVLLVASLICCFGFLQPAKPQQAAAETAKAAPSNLGVDPETLSPEDVAKRNALMKPGLALLKKGDADGAYKALWPARKAYPQDLRVLRYSAEAAFFSQHNAEALDLFTRALAQHPYEPWPLRLAILQLDARMAKWDEFDHGLAALREAKKSDTDHQLDTSSGFLIDSFEAGAADARIPVQTIVFPLQSDPYHTLFRFLLPKQSPAKTHIQAGVNADTTDPSCTNPDFRPYIDLESDDVDQAAFKQAHPELAAKGERTYSLDTYSTPCAQGLMKFYEEGEPAYEKVRDDVIEALSAAGPAEKPESEKTPTPEVQPAPVTQPSEAPAAPSAAPASTPPR
jgi:tetratricopeptide (TPR) repeat protein